LRQKQQIPVVMLVRRPQPRLQYRTLDAFVAMRLSPKGFKMAKRQTEGYTRLRIDASTEAAACCLLRSALGAFEWPKAEEGASEGHSGRAFSSSSSGGECSRWRSPDQRLCESWVELELIRSLFAEWGNWGPRSAQRTSSCSELHEVSVPFKMPLGGPLFAFFNRKRSGRFGNADNLEIRSSGSEKVNKRIGWGPPEGGGIRPRRGPEGSPEPPEGGRWGRAKRAEGGRVGARPPPDRRGQEIGSGRKLFFSSLFSF